MTASRGVRGRALAAAWLAICCILPACDSDQSQRAAGRQGEIPVVVFFGDSITRGQGVSEGLAFPALLQRKLDADGIQARCLNAGVSGDTTESALERIDEVARSRPSIVVVELGANDAPHGLNRARTHINLRRIVRTFREAGANVILARTVFPHLQHPAYTLSMERTFGAIAEEDGATLIPDLMAGVAGERDLNLADGIHPNAAGHVKLAETAWPAVRAALAARR